jgi:hypothetical protein
MMSSSKSSAAEGGSFSHPQVIDDEQLRLSQLLDEDFALAPDGSIRQVLQQLVGFPVDDEKAVVADGSPADRLGDVAFACARRPQEESVLPLTDELPGGQLEE